MEKLRKFHHFLIGQLLGSILEELIDDWLDLTVLVTGKRAPALKNRLVGDAENAQGTSQLRISEST